MVTPASGALATGPLVTPARPGLSVLEGGARWPRTAAVIDLGSNSWRLVIFRYVPGGWWRHVARLQEPVRIAAGAGRSGRLRPAAIARGLDTLDVFARYCRARGLAAEDAEVVATSAIRDAANGDELIERAGASTGFAIRVLSAEEEARYGYLAAVNSTTLRDGMVLDLGGGSLQLVDVRDRRPASLGSWPLGAVRLTERLLPGSGPASRKEIKRARTEIRRELEQVGWLGAGGPRAVAIGGSARSLAAAAGGVLEAADLRRLVAQLAKLPARRRALPPIKPARADIVLAAALVLEAVVDIGSFDALEVSRAGLREGVFFAERLLAGHDPLIEDVRRSSVRNLAHQHDVDILHASRVAELALELHDSLVAAEAIVPDVGERELLWAASMLHDVGMTISYDGHPTHSEYLVRSASLPGFDSSEGALIAQMVRSYRRGDTTATGSHDDRRLIARCALLVRLADCLDCGEHEAVRDARLDVAGKIASLRIEGDDRLARWTVERQMDHQAFRRAFGLRLALDG